MDKKRQDEIKKYFDGLYRSGITPWKNHPEEPQLNRFISLLRETNRDAKVLDVGCGDGWISIKLAESSFEVWGIDGSHKAIELAKALSSQEGVQFKTHFQVGDVLNLPYKKEFFDAAIDRGLFHHILPVNRSEYLNNILRVLKKGALFYLTVFSKKNPKGIGQMFDNREVEKIFSSHFKITYSSADKLSAKAPAHLLHFIMRKIT
jgi:ubiquinone/menaquinone biosynthesis C-methylase UbiE